MQENEKLTRFTANFIDELAKSGLAHAVISPGSRSTPLAMTVCEHPAIQEWIVVDERTAAYFALGMAKQTKMPVALICTSGTAAANYFPALIEAYYNRVPLIVLTADRPHELRDIGAPQVIDQIKLFGEHVKWFHEMSQPEATDEMLAYVRTTANRAIHIAKSGNPGPVHINFPFRDPLVPNFSIENLWGNIRKWCDGLINTSGTYKYKSYAPYNDTASGYLSGGTISADNSAYIDSMTASNGYGFLPSATVADEPNSSYHDIFYKSTSDTYVCRTGGFWSAGSSAGLFCLYLSDPASSSTAGFGASLSFTPQ